VIVSDVSDASDDDEQQRMLEEGTETEQEQLLILQYRMGETNPLQALATMVLPFVFSHDVSENLREALLEAVFFDESSSNTEVHVWLPQCLGLLGLSHQWTTVCLVLVRLKRCYPCSQTPLTDFISLKVLEGIHIALEEEDLYVLHPIVTWLLPLLDNKQELWTRLFQSHEETTQSRALVTTAVLCSILPSLLSTTLPTNTNTQAAPPIQHESLWKLILYSLQQGMDSVKLMGGGFGQSSSQSKEQLLRRRGLHLLRLLVEENGQSLLWLKYVTCFEALEMETEQHLVDQVWDTVSEICVGSMRQEESKELPHLEWTWISAMLSRVLLSDTPVLRKLGLYRFLSGHAGIAINDTEVQLQTTTTKKKERDKKKLQAPLSLVSTDFCLQVIIPSYDTLGQSVGTNLQLQENGKVHVHDITPLLETFLGVYVKMLDESRRAEFFRGLFGNLVVNDLRLKTTVMVYEAVASVDTGLEVDQELLQTAIASFGLLFNCNSVVAVYRDRLLGAFATILSRSSTSNAVDPKVMLKVLSLYPISASPRVDYESNENKLVDNPKYAALQKWLANLGDSSSWASTVGGACASAFVLGQLFPPTGDWVPESGSAETERLMGGAIVLLCALSAEDTPSSLLWPAIHKGLSTVPPHGWYNASRTCRSLVLLENACRLGVVSGMGNGEMVVDQKEQMMPPPPNIESLLANAVGFILRHVEALTSFDSGAKKAGNTRSSNTGRVSSTFALLISQMQVLCYGYPSSVAVSTSANKMFTLSMGRLLKEQLNVIETVRYTALAFGALSCGADPETSIASCRLILHLEFTGEVDKSVSNEQTARSVFQYAKWGTLSYILRAGLDSNKVSESEKGALVKELLNVAEESVYATPSDALLPLFDCVVMTARSSMSIKKTTGRDDSFAENLSRIISALFAVMTDSPSGRKAFYMLDEICALLFRPNLLIDEFERLQRDGEDAPTPIRNAFRHLMEMAGTKRPHISKAALCRISMAWLGNHSEEGTQINAGLGAIPYRKDIANLLVHKEAKIEESSAQQVPTEASTQVGVMELPVETNETSVARGFILTFISSLPDENEGLPRETLVDLLHYVIFYLLDDVCLVPPQSGSMLMTGTLEYSLKIRAWQGLCVLSRFVTEDIAADVCDRVFAAMSQNLHCQIRYFLEAFAIQFARRHPSIFGRRLVTEIRRRDLFLQHISSLMIISGNLIVGRYKDDFFRQYENGDQHVVNLDEILAGVMPWLSSTQGFTRVISQLLVHKLIPLIIQIEDIDDSDDAGSDWFLKSMYLFLDENPEMKRLRKKQSKFFDCYNVDDTCSSKNLLCLEVDDGAEADPEHMIDAIKKCLEQVYLEAREHEAPMWKQVADMLERDKSAASQRDFPVHDNELVNFQRKIIPLDSLELDLEESRQKRLRNALGRKKQQLVVCASLIDKVPNLAGLARTSEIFAASRLVIPDTRVCRMDNFKIISVGAGEWIDIEECKESVSVSCCLFCRTFDSARDKSCLPNDYCHFYQDLF
jgi:hypothetical protein